MEQSEAGSNNAFEALTPLAIHRARRGLAYVWHDSDLGIEKVQLTILNCKIAGRDSAPL
ncbi:hypothetical protein [Rhodopirellula europaea]|uniref:Uncharacterized protein n=1 Tax=Rhodopirellula europaea 6C TaxID=1263867 RepID=M2AY66_9BACT|nr:hypothetical protein RE6C_04890 [Rhodopirellula europaea 6C]